MFMATLGRIRLEVKTSLACTVKYPKALSSCVVLYCIQYVQVGTAIRAGDTGK